EDGQLEDMLKLLHYYLEPGGLLIFDLNTEYKFRNILDGQTFVYDEDDAYCVWSNEYDNEEKICYFDLNFFLKNEDGSYTRQDEYQQERVYSIEEIKETVERCNLKCVGVFDNLTFDEPKENSDRVFVVVQKYK
ncbi:MAG: class I SAM-dependent methyltransferase, partial [Clostridia bacterium]|nr:class I SAM-dependent methyltransferase [Clostridia bacterium]